MLGIFDFLILSFSLALTLTVIVPFTGVLVRFRANYNPKSLHLDTEGGVVPHTGPVVTSYIAMFGRVYRIEVCKFRLQLLRVFNKYPKLGLVRTLQGAEYVASSSYIVDDD